MIEVQNLVKSYGKTKVLDNISFKVNDGEILGFLGPNGAGKSTTMNIITGFLALSSGNVKVGGIDIFKKPIKAKRKIGYLPETPSLYQDMTVKAYLNFVFDLKKVKLNKNEHIQEICKTVGIDEVQNRVIKNLSKGYKQRVGLAQALVGYPEILILDEPTVGLDPKQIIEIRNLIKSLAEKHTVILSSHILPEVQAICDRILVINKGKIVADDTPDNLSKNISAENKLRVVIDGNEEDALSAIKSLEKVVDVKKVESDEPETCVFDVTCEEDTKLKKQLAMAVNKTGAILLSANNINMSLEDIFLKLTEETDEPQEETAVEAETSQDYKTNETSEDAKPEVSNQAVTEEKTLKGEKTDKPADEPKEEAAAETETSQNEKTNETSEDVKPEENDQAATEDDKAQGTETKEGEDE